MIAFLPLNFHIARRSHPQPRQFPALVEQLDDNAATVEQQMLSGPHINGQLRDGSRYHAAAKYRSRCAGVILANACS